MFHFSGAGLYHFVFSNEEAWIRSLYIYYRIQFYSSSDPEDIIHPEPIENGAYAGRYLAIKQQLQQQHANEVEEAAKKQWKYCIIWLLSGFSPIFARFCIIQ